MRVKDYEVGDVVNCPVCGGGCTYTEYDNASGDSVWSCSSCGQTFTVTCNPPQYKWEESTGMDGDTDD